MRPRRLVRPCVSALGASYHAFCRPASVADEASVERPPYLPGGDGTECAPCLFYLLFKLFLGCIILIVRVDELGGNALLDKGHIVVYEPHDFVVVLRLFVTYAPALNNFELGEGHLYGFDAFAVYGGRKDERIGFL